MRKVFTILLVLFVGFYSTAALCLCAHEEVKVSSHPCHEEQGEASHSQAESLGHHSHEEQAFEGNQSSHPSHQSENNCCCIQKDESSLPTKIEFGSLVATNHLILFIVSSVQSLSINFSVTSPLNTLHSLSPPGSPPLYLKKNTFLI